MAPTWDELGNDYAENSNVQIARLDCTKYQPVCTRFKVTGYPSLHYFMDGGSTGHTYKGPREKKGLTQFIETTLRVGCEVSSIGKEDSKCNVKETDYYEKMKGKTSSEIEDEVKRLEGMKDGSMSKSAKKWIQQRLFILKQIK